jgi:threonine aldolase
MGGAMRQTGILAAAGIYALENNIERLLQDHNNATLLSNKLSLISDIQVLNLPTETNIVLFKWTSSKMSSAEFHKECLKNNIRFYKIGDNLFRAMTHLNISNADIDYTIDVINKIACDMIKTPN